MATRKTGQQRSRKLSVKKQPLGDMTPRRGKDPKAGFTPSPGSFAPKPRHTS